MVIGKADREGVEPRKVRDWDGPMVFMEPAGDSALCGMASARNRPGVLAASSLTWRPCGNQGDPAVGVGKRDAPSNKCKKRGGGQRQPEVGGAHKSDEAW
jgi:hypothetical protein